MDAKENRPEHLNAVHLTYSLLAINQSSIYSTAFGLTNCILDLLSSPQCDDIIRAMRKECVKIKTKHEGFLGSTEALSELCLMDSCIKESLRISGFNTVAVIREVRFTRPVQTLSRLTSHL